MNTRTSVAVGIGVGYLLGRTHRTKVALMLGAAAATGRFNGLPAQVLERGTKALRSTPELADLADGAQRLLDAGRTAAIAAMTSRVSSLGEALEGRVQETGERLRGSVPEKDMVKPGRRGRDEERDEYDEDRDEYDDQDLEDDYEDEEQEDQEQEDQEQEDQEQKDQEPEYEEERVSAGGRRRSSAGGSGRRPVVRRNEG